MYCAICTVNQYSVFTPKLTISILSTNNQVTLYKNLFIISSIKACRRQLKRLFWFELILLLVLKPKSNAISCLKMCSPHGVLRGVK